MSSITSIVFWFVLCVIASFVVAGRIDSGRDRVAYYLLIWLVPIIGAVAAILLSRRHKSGGSSSQGMIDAIADAQKRKDAA